MMRECCNAERLPFVPAVISTAPMDAAIPVQMVDPPIVADTVKGSRRDLTIGPIKVTGIPDPVYCRKQKARERYGKLLAAKEAELLELTTQAEEYIETIQSSELRIMFRLYFIDGLSDLKVADRMNRTFPKRKKKYTDESVKKRRQRFFEKFANVPQCPDERC